MAETAYQFEPNISRGAWIDANVRKGAAASLSILGEAIAEQRPDLQSELRRYIAAAKAGPVKPGFFALYSDLVDAIFSEDEDAFRSAAQTIATFDPRAVDATEAGTLSDDDLGDGMAARFGHRLDDDPDLPINFRPIAAEELKSARACLAQTWILLDRAAPELAHEIRCLIRNVLFVTSQSPIEDFVFHGASTFYLWGAVFLNPAIHTDRIKMAEGLTHEAAHLKLFGCSLGAPLVDNDPAARFSSPLREDPRPMDGLVHAAYVVARMYYCFERLLASDLVSTTERELLEAAKTRRRREYFDAMDIISAHARFTPVGRSLFDAAQAFMLAAR
jgi:HEXXH motif-containing protein